MSPEALVLAVASAVRPSTSLAAVYALLSTARPRKLLAAFVAGGLTVSMGIGVLVVTGLHGVGLPGGDGRFTHIVDVVAGTAALGFARRGPRGAQDLIERVNHWMRRHQQALLVAVFAAVGAFLVVKGLAGLLG